MNKYNIGTLLLGLSIAIFNSPAAIAEKVRYVSDTLTSPMRSGTTTRHNILKFLPSGTPVKILEIAEEEGYSRVIAEDMEGWVENNRLMDEPSAPLSVRIRND